jgi:hypothetical protein
MATAPTYDVAGTRYDEPRNRPFWQTCLTGCAIIFAILLVLAVLIGVWISRNFRGWVSDVGSTAMKQMVAESQLPPDQKQSIAGQIDRVADAFRSGRLSLAEMRNLMEKITRSPMMASIMATVADKKYIANSDLSEEEKTEGRITVRRFARGVIDRKIDQAATQSVMAPISEPGPGGGRQLKPIVTDQELRTFLKDAKDQADKAGIPDQPENIDMAAEFKKIVDESLGNSGDAAGPALPAPDPTK